MVFVILCIVIYLWFRGFFLIASCWFQIIKSLSPTVHSLYLSQSFLGKRHFLCHRLLLPCMGRIPNSIAEDWQLFCMSVNIWLRMRCEFKNIWYLFPTKAFRLYWLVVFLLWKVVLFRLIHSTSTLWSQWIKHAFLYSLLFAKREKIVLTCVGLSSDGDHH